MTLCNFSAYLHYESGIFNVNVYIDMKTEFKIVVYFINVLTPGKRVCTHGSEFAWGVQIFHQVCFYKSHLLRWKWRMPLSGQVLCVRNGNK